MALRDQKQCVHSSDHVDFAGCSPDIGGCKKSAANDPAFGCALGKIGIRPDPAGFIIGGTDGTLFVYKPEPLPEKPAFVRAATPLPPITFKDFGRNYVGKGKYRKDAGPKTPEQFRVQELENLYPKALQGDAAAKREIAMESLSGKFVVENPWVAEKWLKEAISAGDAIAPRGYAELLNRWKTNVRAEELVTLYWQSAERGDVPAMIWLVEYPVAANLVPAAEKKKWTGLATAQDAKFAKRQEIRTRYATNLPLAEAGDAEACYIVAQTMMEGISGIPGNNTGEEFLRKAIAKGHPAAMRTLAVLMEIRAGAGPFASDTIAAEFRQFLTGAAEGGDREALIRLAGYLAEGQRSFDKDHARAYATHLKLAESGYAPSMAIVGRALYTGTLATKDQAAGLAWIRKAADANDQNAKQILADIEKLDAREAARPPLDAKLEGVTPEVFAALKSIQTASTPAIDEAALRKLIDAVWFDADYSNLDEDLAQELADAKRPVMLTSSDGQSVTFDKPLPTEATVNFGQIFPVNFQPTNLQFYFVLWQRTTNAGLLVGGTRVSVQAKSSIEGALAKGMYDMAIKAPSVATSELTQYFNVLKASHDAATPKVQNDFRNVIRSSLDKANRAAEMQANVQLKPYINLLWLKEP